MQERQQFTTTQVAKILGKGKSTIKEWCKKGWLPTVREGNRYMISRSVLEGKLRDIGRSTDHLSMFDTLDGTVAEEKSPSETESPERATIPVTLY